MSKADVRLAIPAELDEAREAAELPGPALDLLADTLMLPALEGRTPWPALPTPILLTSLPAFNRRLPMDVLPRLVLLLL